MVKTKMYPFTNRLTLDLSGFGGGYENHCQVLLHAALWSIENDPKLVEKDGSGNFIQERIDLLQARMIYLTKEWGEDEGGTTGAQIGVATSTALYIHNKGYVRWIEEIFRLGRQCDLYVWDGTVKSCKPLNPEVEAGAKLARKMFEGAADAVSN